MLMIQSRRSVHDIGSKNDERQSGTSLRLGSGCNTLGPGEVCRTWSRQRQITRAVNLSIANRDEAFAESDRVKPSCREADSGAGGVGPHKREELPRYRTAWRMLVREYTPALCPNDSQ